MSEMIKKLTPGHYNRFGWNDGDLQPVVTAEQRSRFGWLGGDLVPSNPMEEVHKSDVAIPQIGWLVKSPVDFYPQGLVVDGDWEIVKESDPFHVFGNVHEAHAFGMKHTLPWLAKLSHREKNDHLQGGVQP